MVNRRGTCVKVLSTLLGFYACAYWVQVFDPLTWSNSGLGLDHRLHLRGSMGHRKRHKPKALDNLASVPQEKRLLVQAGSDHFLIPGLISRSTRSGPGRPVARSGQFLLRILLAWALEVALAGLGLGMIRFYYESY